MRPCIRLPCNRALLMDSYINVPYNHHTTDLSLVQGTLSNAHDMLFDIQHGL